MSSPGDCNREDGSSASRLHPRRDFLARSISAAGVGAVSSVFPPFVAPALAEGDASGDAGQGTIDPSIDMPKVTSKVYLEIKFGNYKPKKLVIGLFGDVMPKTVENFVALCTNTEGPSYSGASFYRVLSGMSIQGGAIGPSSNSGKSGTSSLPGGKPFAPDNFSIRHTKAGLVSAVRTANGEIDSRFFVQTENDAGWADDRYAAFGIVLDEGDGTGGMELVRKISRVDVKAPQNNPKDPVTIVGSGVVE